MKCQDVSLLKSLLVHCGIDQVLRSEDLLFARNHQRASWDDD